MLTLSLKSVAPNVYILQLVDGKRILTESGLHIPHEILYQFWQEYLTKVLTETAQDWTPAQHPKIDGIVYAFAYQFLLHSPLTQEVEDFINLICRENGDILYGMNAVAYYNQNDNKDKKLILQRLYRIYLHLSYFRSQEGYYNAQTQLVDIAPSYQLLHENIYLDHLYFWNLYSIDHYRTLFYYILTKAKGFQDSEEIQKIYRLLFAKTDSHFQDFLNRKQITHLCMIPNNIRRAESLNQLIKEKISQEYPQYDRICLHKNESSRNLPQKSLKGMEQRIQNATRLFDMDEDMSWFPGLKHILLIDDVFGSGATMNMLAKKIKARFPDVIITGFAFLGSYRKGFDVLNEV